METQAMYLFQSVLVTIFVHIVFINLLQLIPQINPIFSSALFYLSRYVFFASLFLLAIFLPFLPTKLLTPSLSMLLPTFVVLSFLIWTAFRLFIYRSFILSPKIILIGNPEKVEDILFKTFSDYLFLKSHSIEKIILGDYTYFKLKNQASYKSPFLCIEKKSTKNINLFTNEISFEAEPGIISNADFNRVMKKVYNHIPKLKNYLVLSLSLILTIAILWGVGYHINRWDTAYALVYLTNLIARGMFLNDPGPFHHQNFELFSLRYSTLKTQPV
jgi:hypothetical protein